MSNGHKKAGRLAAPTTDRAGRAPEYTLLVTVTFCLLAAGVLMVFSASSSESLLTVGGDPGFYLKRSLMYGLLGLLVMRVCARVSLQTVREAAPLLLVGALVLMLAVAVPGVGVSAKGAQRWLGLGPVQFQPSEFAKLALIIFAAAWIARDLGRARRLTTMVKPLLAVVALVLFIAVVMQSDLGTGIVICASIAVMLVAAGTPLRAMGRLSGGLVGVAMLMIAMKPYRMERLTSFLDPSADPSGVGFQAAQAKIAIGSGGVLGVGAGESVQKAFYLPEAHTDMVLAVLGEEFGLLGMLVMIVLYGLIAYAGLRIAKQATDAFSRLLAVGITGLIMCQALLNFFAVMGMAPLTGVPLPFISYGNSSLIVLLASMGLLMNIAKGNSAQRVRAIPGRGVSSESRSSSGRDRGSRRSGPGSSRRTAQARR